MDNKYTEFIENYLMNDKTKSAIMLVGGWGTGKSFYIQNVLKPCLEREQKDRCIIVSLYGLNDLKDISKAIYLEARTKKLRTKISKIKIFKKAENQESAKIVGKTIVKGITSFFNVDLTSNEDDLQNLYESLDLSGKLIILEDLERTDIPIKDVLGYVNNLVEQDGVKVLLVANEKEILKSEQVIVGKNKENNDIKKWEWTIETQEYLKIKEKSISDTIPYVCDFLETIENIIDQFKDKNVESLLIDKLYKKETEATLKTEKEIKREQQLLYFEIIAIANEICDLNLRSFIFACQKTTDILRLYGKEIDRLFVKYLFMSIVAFSFRIKTNDKLYWDDKQSGYSLGTSQYPLYRFAHDYIKYQNLNVDEIKKAEETFLEQKKAESEQNKAKFYLDILYDFYLTSSEVLEMAIREIKKNLEDGNVIDIIIYGKLANYLIAVRELIDNPILIDDCKKAMIKNLETKVYDGDKVNDRLSIHDSFRFWTEEQESEYNNFIGEMKKVVKNKRNNELNFDYKIENIETFIQDIKNNRNDYIDQHTFLKRIDISKLIDVIKQCSSKQIYDLRGAISAVYSFSNICEFFMDDKTSLLELKNGIADLLSNEEDSGDKIKRLQLSWFNDNLERILEKLS